MLEKLKAIDAGYVTRWKIESNEELELSHNADTNIEKKTEYCNFYKQHNPEYYEKGVEMAKQVINDHDGLNLLNMNEEELVEDMIYCLHRFGFNYKEYFWFKLYNLNTFGRDGFISDKMRFEYYMELNTKYGENILRDKWKAYERLKQYYHRECLSINTSDDKSEYDRFVKKHKTFFYKPLASDSANGCCTVNSNNTSFDKLLSNGPFIMEELIIQNGDFSEFYHDAVNIVRIPVLTTKDGNVHLMGPFITLGQKNMVAVNAGAGGIIATVDSETGVVISNGWLENSEIEFSYHPETHKRIIGYQIPDWDKAVKMCKEAAQLIPECKYIGFDLAQTSDGWIIIEGNCYAQFLGQRGTEGLKRKMLKYLEMI